MSSNISCASQNLCHTMVFGLGPFVGTRRGGRVLLHHIGQGEYASHHKRVRRISSSGVVYAVDIGCQGNFGV